MSISFNKPPNEGEHTRRSIFSPQPARVLLLDSNVFEEKCLGKSVIEALERIFLLTANLNGSCPVPLIGIYLLTIYPEIILPLSHTKSNFVRLHSALTDLQNFFLDDGKLEQYKHADCCVVEGVAEACRQFRRYTGNLPANSGNFHQLELVFITTRQESEVKKQFTSLPEQADLNIIKRIVCANISSMFNDTQMDTPESGLDLMSDDFASLVDMVTLESDPLSLQKFLYSWLGDSTSDTEHLKLILPSPSPVDPQIVIKCDLTDKIINPLQLPIYDSFSLDVKSNVCKHVFPPASKALGLQAPIFQLKALHSIPRQNVCDSLLFGQPIAMHSTGCWKMDWDCLENNQQMFNALCSEMLKKDHILLTRLLHPGQNGTSMHARGGTGFNHDQHPMSINSFDSIKASTSPHNSNNNNNNNKPSGLFVLIPSEKSMLMKSVACRELYLPSNRTAPSGPINEESRLCIQASLSKVEELSQFNPLDFQSGLFDALKTVSLPKSYINKARQQQQQQQHTRMHQVMQKKTDIRPPVMTPGGRVTASGWSGNISDASGGPYASSYPNKKTLSGGKAKKSF